MANVEQAQSFSNITSERWHYHGVLGSFVHRKDKQSLKILSHQTFHHKHEIPSPVWPSREHAAFCSDLIVFFVGKTSVTWQNIIFVFLFNIPFSLLVTHKCHSPLFLSSNCENCSLFLLYMPIKQVHSACRSYSFSVGLGPNSPAKQLWLLNPLNATDFISFKALY